MLKINNILHIIDDHFSVISFIFVAACFISTKAQSQVYSEAKASNKKEIDKSKKAEFSSSYVMRGASFKEGPDEAQFVQLLVNPNVKLRLNNAFDITFDATLSLNSSRVQTRFNDPSLNTINPNEILLNYRPNYALKFSLGAINQEHLDSPALVQSGLAFPGAIGTYKFKKDNLSLKLKAQYTIPNSTSLESDRVANEAMPSFITGGAEFKWEPKTWLKTSANVNYFSYTDLPSIVAFNSGRMGNEVSGVNQSESFFAYDFRGFAQSYKVSADLSKRVSSFLNIRSVDNLEAPSKRERAQSIKLGSEINFKNFSVIPSIAFFYAESDASPALYTDPSFGRNNREGESYGLKFDFKKLGFSFKASYVNSDLIVDKPVQNDLEYFELQVGVANVSF